MSNTPLQQGDTFPIRLAYMKGLRQQAIPSGYDLLVCVYDSRGNLLAKGSVGDGRVVYEGNEAGVGIYVMRVSHDESALMSGNVSIETTLMKTDLSLVDHADDALSVKFDSKMNNKYIASSNSVSSFDDSESEMPSVVVSVGNNTVHSMFSFKHPDAEPQPDPEEPSDSYNEDFNNDF